ncbi:hypothetical protein V8G54_031601, partial [Vigna mungo]
NVKTLREEGGWVNIDVRRCDAGWKNHGKERQRGFSKLVKNLREGFSTFKLFSLLSLSLCSFVSTRTLMSLIPCLSSSLIRNHSSETELPPPRMAVESPPDNIVLNLAKLGFQLDIRLGDLCSFQHSTN